MHILICTGPMLPVPAVAGGSVHRMWYAMAQYFASQGHQVTVVGRRWPGLPDRQHENGVDYIRKGGFNPSGWLPWDLLRDLWQGIRIAPGLPGADVVVVNDFFLPMLMPKRCGAMVINANRYPKGQYRWYRKATRVFAASSYVAEVIRQQAPSLSDRVGMLPNAVKVDAFVGENHAPVNRMLFAGRLNPEKGLDLLFTSLKKLQRSDWELTVMGPHAIEEGGGGEDYLQQLKSQAEGLPITFRPACFDAQELGDIYRSHGTFVYPSQAALGETAPVAPVEAMAAGMLVVCSDLDCFSDYLVDRQNGLQFDHTSGESLTGLINHLLDHAGQWQSVRQAGVQTASRYDISQVSESWLQALQGLCN